jgi:hypothetical protein
LALHFIDNKRYIYAIMTRKNCAALQYCCLPLKQYKLNAVAFASLNSCRRRLRKFALLALCLHCCLHSKRIAPPCVFSVAYTTKTNYKCKSASKNEMKRAHTLFQIGAYGKYKKWVYKTYIDLLALLHY